MLGVSPEDLINRYNQAWAPSVLCKDREELRLFLIYLSREISFSPNPEFKLETHEIGFARLMVARENAATLNKIDRKLLCKQFVKIWGIFYGHKKHKSLTGQEVLPPTDIFAEIDQGGFELTEISDELSASITKSIREVKASYSIVNKLASKQRPTPASGIRKQCEKPPETKKPKVEQIPVCEESILSVMSELHGMLVRMRSI